MKKYSDLSKSSVLYQFYWSLWDPYLTNSIEFLGELYLFSPNLDPFFQDYKPKMDCSEYQMN